MFQWQYLLWSIWNVEGKMEHRDGEDDVVPCGGVESVHCDRRTQPATTQHRKNVHWKKSFLKGHLSQSKVTFLLNTNNGQCVFSL